MDAQDRQRRLGRAAALVQLVDPGAGPGLLVILDRQDAVAERDAARDREIHQRPRALAGDDVVMPGLAADDAAERDHRVVGLPSVRGRVERDGDGRREFRARRRPSRHRPSPARRRRPRARREKLVGDVVVEARLDDEDARAGNGRMAGSFACVATM